MAASISSRRLALKAGAASALATRPSNNRPAMLELPIVHGSRAPDTVELAWPLILPAPRAVGTGARLCRPRPTAARCRLPTPSNLPRAAAGLRHSRAPFQWRAERDPGLCFFHTLRKSLHRVRNSVLIAHFLSP